LLKYRYFQAPYVVEFTLSPDEPLMYAERTRTRHPDSPGATDVGGMAQVFWARDGASLQVRDGACPTRPGRGKP
jgi:hypothetical protein